MTPDQEARFHAERATGLGGSDAAVVCGVSPWKSPLQLWAEKTGRVEPEDISDQPHIRRGNELEPVVAKMYAAETGRAIRLPHELPNSGFFRHPDAAFMIAHPDGFTAAEPGASLSNGDGGVLEIKTGVIWNINQWGPRELDPVEKAAAPGPVPTASVVPIHYQIQLQHYLAVTGRAWGAFAVALCDDTYRGIHTADGGVIPIGVRAFLWLDVPRHEPFIEVLMQRCAEFWDCVQKNVRPNVLPSAQDRGFIADLLGPEVEDKSIDLGDEGAELVAQIHDAMNVADDAADRKKEAEARLMDMMGDAAVGVLPNGKRCTFKTQCRKAYVPPPVQEWKGRVFRAPQRPRREK